ncbi:MAG: hypothetical protein GY793_05115 [Proteobacteria bacterium]|nr:hypothetical protein [Pseudomonadota bacterium]
MNSSFVNLETLNSYEEKQKKASSKKGREKIRQEDPDTYAEENKNLLKHVMEKDENNSKNQQCYIGVLYGLLIFWTVLSASILILQGFGHIYEYNFNLDKEIIISFVYSVLGQVLGGFLLLSNHLFRESSHIKTFIEKFNK